MWILLDVVVGITSGNATKLVFVADFLGGALGVVVAALEPGREPSLRDPGREPSRREPGREPSLREAVRELALEPARELQRELFLELVPRRRSGRSSATASALRHGSVGVG
ncbi:hypothetical protein L596_005235 [Steinernema carpocapsae]|uniref:Uncharacterized protein n=1 Tax=Steinernema carpocapsae TaxID=34508 RepID=A0A4U8UYG8_STECR|nr:hypothetical protein L596_005235 [Steinernema carpocapsae]